MKTTVVETDNGFNIEIPLTKEEFKRLKENVPSYLTLGEYIEELIQHDDLPQENLNLPADLIARIRRDIILKYLESMEKFDADFIISNVGKLVNFCLKK